MDKLKRILNTILSLVKANASLLKRVAPAVIAVIAALVIFQHWPMSFPEPSKTDPQMHLTRVLIGLEEIDNTRVKLINRAQEYEPYPGLVNELSAIMERHTYHRTSHAGGLGAPKEGFTMTIRYLDREGEPVTLSWGGDIYISVNGKTYRCDTCREMMRSIAASIEKLKPVSVQDTDIDV